jgi:hypothetical protein
VSLAAAGHWHAAYIGSLSVFYLMLFTMTVQELQSRLRSRCGSCCVHGSNCL